jgi:excisionase family DNA binding protein
MQIEDNRYYRVKAVAEMLDVSPSTIYRAIESGRLDALKVGTGKGALRIPGPAITAYLNECGPATRSAVDADQSSLNSAQADGLACVVCEVSFLETAVAHRPVGRSQTGSQVFACTVHADQAGGLFGEVA